MPIPWNAENQTGEEIQAGNYTLVPFAKTWQVQSENGRAGFVWTRPTAILVRSADGQEKVLQIPDLTLRIIFSLVGVCLGATLVMTVIALIRRR